MKAIRLLDYTFSLLGLILLSPLLLIVALLIKIESQGDVLYKQTRIGKDEQPFLLLKFRTMVTGSDKSGLLTVGGKDARITRLGFFLRKYKIDELPQLLNVIKGEMSLVGPRPEVEKYVNLYSKEQKAVLKLRPGITDMASIVYRNENELLAQANDPEHYYIHEIMPRKIALNQYYIRNQSIKEYLRIIIQTILTSVKGK